MPLDRALSVGYGDIDAYGFHTLEVLQCMVERRRGAEKVFRRYSSSKAKRFGNGAIARKGVGARRCSKRRSGVVPM